MAQDLIRVLVAEDHETVREGLRCLLNAQTDMEVVGEAGNGRVAVEQARTLNPTVVVVDLSMPEMNGLLAVRNLRESVPSAGLVALTRHSDRSYVTDREAGVLRLMAVGHSNKQIGTTLGISVKTVEVHKANAMRKLNLSGRTEVVRYAALQGWLQDP